MVRSYEFIPTSSLISNKPGIIQINVKTTADTISFQRVGIWRFKSLNKQILTINPEY